MFLFCSAQQAHKSNMVCGRVKGLKGRTGVTGAGHMIRRALPLQGVNGMKDLLVAPKNKQIQRNNRLKLSFWSLQTIARNFWILSGNRTCEILGELLPIIPDPIIELIKLKDADIIELFDSPAAFWEGMIAVPSPFSCCENKSNMMPSQNHYQSVCLCPHIASPRTYLLRHFEQLSVVDVVPLCWRLFGGLLSHIYEVAWKQFESSLKTFLISSLTTEECNWVSSALWHP